MNEVEDSGSSKAEEVDPSDKKTTINPYDAALDIFVYIASYIVIIFTAVMTRKRRQLLTRLLERVRRVL
jgi:hypothetical protein